MKSLNLHNSEVAAHDPELIDDDNPEWTDEMFARAVPFSGCPRTCKTALRGEARRSRC